jgi:hypothetical protein
MTNRISLACGVVVAASLAGCGAIQLKPGAESIRLTSQEPQGCDYLGQVIGSQSGTSDGELLARGATNDLMNKASALGGNVVQVLASQGVRKSSTIEGVAYLCPNGR